MWRNLSRQSYLRKLKFLTESHPSLNAFSAVRSPQDSLFVEKATPLGPQSHVYTRNCGSGFSQDLIFWRKCDMRRLKYASSCDPSGFCGDTRGYATAAEAFVSTSEEEVDEIQELIEEVNKEMKVKSSDIMEHKQPKMVGGMGLGKYNSLRRRQIKMETEAWEEAAREYQELLVDMCEQKLAPNLPYIKSLFLGWFEPLRDAIAAEQDLCKEGKNRGAYAPYFDQLPADMMAVITMHKLMGLLMTGGWNGSARVVQAACHIGEAIEHEVRIHKFLENCKRKNALNRTSEEGPDPEAKEQERLSKKVKMLMKKQKIHQVRKIVRQQDDLKPWGQDAQVKVGCRLIQILTQTAYIQPPVDQMDDAPPDIRPAFVHTLKSVETVKGTRRYGVIECDPLVCKGLEKTARHMVIPYMPMLVPPLNWTGYERGAYLFLPSYMMRTHGAKQQREAVKRAPKLQLEPIFQALNTLGNTKWRVNKRILSVVDRIWANGGRLADLVDREDVPLPEEPDTEDEAEIKKWKWKVKAVKKENSERHSQRVIQNSNLL
ncbi:DNA-directed RNA polymerase 1, mitochondrial [Sesamum angolense]|uniref:DNA-directed RNA polymerase n=1 Tax=Sesamum angolense TaxID=2727404 RepID=A0AAE2C640_9LAMI|nr:DNA-directed RNA polymerase 1, mitochondrial [Sesamum angolense]